MTGSFVLYVDMLGFSNLVRQNESGVGQLIPVYRSLGEKLSDVLDDDREPTNELVRQFTLFHRCLVDTRNALQRERVGHTALTFSDSFFAQSESFEAVAWPAIDLMRSLIIGRVPARMGVGYGSFQMLRFYSDFSEQMTTHCSQFTGTGVVLAYATAESSKGMRIFLAAEVAQHMAGGCRCITTDGGAVRELNFLHAGTDEQQQLSDLSLYRAVAQMRTGAPEEAQVHYDQTFKALDRMRQQHGRRPYSAEDYMID